MYSAAPLGLFDKYFSKFGIDISFVPLNNVEPLGAMPSSRRHGYCIARLRLTPSVRLPILSVLSGIARQAGARLVVDNCFCTPVLQQPLKHGADIIIHSATKYLDGQGRVMGGAVVGNARRYGRGE